ncbi:SGNH/GDSL hydrolase family protein [Microbacterium pumilum]
MTGNRRALPYLVAVALTLGLVAPPSVATAATTSASAAPALIAPKVMAALGDSVSRASVADGTSGDNLLNSWSSGTSASVVSHRARIIAATGSNPTAYNLAQGGTETSDLIDQAAAAVARKADYVTVLSGGNNICHSETLADLPTVKQVRADFDKTLAILNDGLPSAAIFVASIPSLMRLYETASDNPLARLTWAVVGACPIMLADPTDRSAAAQSRRAAVEDRVEDLNAAIGAACAAAENCTGDDDAVHDLDITMADISTRDYFHPSVSGQAMIAAATWAKVIAKNALAAPAPAPAPAPEADPVINRVDNTSPYIDWTGTWATASNPADLGGSVSFIKSMSSSYSLQFTGIGISIESRTTPSAGISEVRIDGQLVGRVDGYSETRAYRQLVFVSARLADGVHTITVTPTMERAVPSTGYNLILDALLVEKSG